jgi:hypothetical protein
MAYQESGEGFRVGVKIRILDRADGSVTQFMDDWLREGSPSWGRVATDWSPTQVVTTTTTSSAGA